MNNDMLWRALHAFAQRETGMNLSPFVASPTMAGLAELAADAGVTSETYLQKAQHDARFRTALVSRVANGTSWFFREWTGFEALLERAKQLRSQTGRTDVRVWCAGCSSGQEAYSIAIVLLDQGFTPTVVGSDIDALSIQRAQQGAYRSSDMLRLPAKYAGYFDGASAPVQVARRVRDRVQFCQQSLFPSGKPPATMPRPDIIMCRHVLMYFDRPAATSIVAEMLRQVSARENLILAAIELPLLPSRATPTTLQGGPGQATPRDQLHRQAMAQPAGPVTTRAASAGASAAPSTTDAVGQLAHGIHCKQQARYAEACTALRISRFLTRDEHWLAPFQLGVCLERIGDLREAVEAYRHAWLVASNGGTSGMVGDGDVEAMRASIIAACQERLRMLG